MIDTLTLKPNCISYKEGKIIASHGNHHLLLQKNSGEFIQCFSKRKSNKVVVGDNVKYTFVSKNQAVILQILPRDNQFERSNCFKKKILASNIHQVIIVVATDPPINEALLNKSLLEAENKNIKPIIILNKIDIKKKLNAARKKLENLRKLGYLILEISAKAKKIFKEEDLSVQKELLLPTYLSNQTSLLIGQSGVGKSTLLNLLVPSAKVKTQSISTALGTGKHTTSLTKLFHLVDGGYLIDSPGFQEFGLNHITQEKLCHAFKEFRPQIGYCRFHNCKHKQEPDCAIINAVTNGNIDLYRYMLYRKILDEGF